ncbi:DUF1697 domain-containing protein [Actinoplanes sp. KI2]|uniref:DUF1697 domain-containing protein n=1 Tax=Actinoplanes sp. KI2 TaxID=2983315 RepID=UPI0021D5F2E4|nr:DUF1697 domain-containing protein [Actinoplanes sp. KI2]MCU7727845.1 DUF1697 domain-containing protein [Actinoplanes sp. KI2]
MGEVTTFLVLLRGINVGGKNKVAMADLKTCLEGLGLRDVSTFIVSGNVVLTSDRNADEIAAQIETALPQAFSLDSELIKVLVLTRDQLQAVVDHRPKGFGDQPDKYHSDAIFLIGVESAEVMPIFHPREGVDRVWPGKGVVYSERLSAQRTKSRLSAMMASPLYQSMTIRSWNTTVKLLELLNARDTHEDGCLAEPDLALRPGSSPSSG